MLFGKSEQLNNSKLQTAPPILTSCDLMNTGIDRNQETA